MVAKTDAAQTSLMAQLKARRVKKTYLALVQGSVAAASRTHRGADRARPEAPHADGRRPRRAPVGHRLPGPRAVRGLDAPRARPRDRAGRTRSGSTSTRSATRSPATPCTAPGPRDAGPDGLERLFLHAWRLELRQPVDRRPHPGRGAAARRSSRPSSPGSATPAPTCPAGSSPTTACSRERAAPRRRPGPRRPARGRAQRRRPGALLVIVSGPSGVGKDTIIDALRRRPRDPDYHYVVTCTTRAPRPGEVDGASYHFLDRERFAALRDAGAFLEADEVHGNWYGTPRAEVRDALAAGHDVILKIDVQGAAVVKASGPGRAARSSSCRRRSRRSSAACAPARPRPPRSSRSASATRRSSSPGPGRLRPRRRQRGRPGRADRRADRRDHPGRADQPSGPPGGRLTDGRRPAAGPGRAAARRGRDRRRRARGRPHLHVRRAGRARRPGARRGRPRRVRAAPGARRSSSGTRSRRTASRSSRSPRASAPTGRSCRRSASPSPARSPTTTSPRPRSSLRAMLPPGLLERLDLVATALTGSAAGRRRRRRPRLLEALGAGSRPTRSLPAAESRPAVMRRLRALEREGRVHLDWTLGAAGARPRYERLATATPEGLAVAAGDRAPDGRPVGPRQRALLAELAAAPPDGPGVGATALAARHGQAALAGLARRGLVDLATRERPRDPLRDRPPGRAAPGRPAPPLTAAQAAAVAAIAAAGAAGDPTPLLLDGVTGGGKTAIYVEAIAASLGAGRPALVLVPEIALALPLVDRLRAELGADVAAAPLGARRRRARRRVAADPGRRRRHRRRDAAGGARPARRTSASSSSTRSTRPPTRATGRRAPGPRRRDPPRARWPARRSCSAARRRPSSDRPRPARALPPADAPGPGRRRSRPRSRSSTCGRSLRPGNRGAPLDPPGRAAERRSTRRPATRRSS